MRSRTRRGPLVAVAATVIAITASCGDDGPMVAEHRAVEVRASGCSLGDRLATGFDLGDGSVLTVAHALRGATSVTVDGRPGAVVAIDHRIDAAVVVDALRRPPAAIASTGGVVGPATMAGGSGGRPVIIDREVTVRIDEPRDDTTYERAGLVLGGDVERGDSGAGIVDSSGRLIGMVFATSRRTDGPSYAVAASELAPFVASATSLDPVDLGACD